MAEKPVPCQGCTACCRSGLPVGLNPFQDDLSKLKFVSVTKSWGEFSYNLKMNDDLTCIHLVDGRCEVYSDRPKVCRDFDCRDSPSRWKEPEYKSIDEAVERMSGKNYLLGK